MAVVKFVNAGSPMNNIFDYVTRREATESKLISGVNCSPESALDEFRFVKKRFHKEDGRSYYHIVQSFSPDDDLTPETAHEIGLKFAEYFPGFQVLVATHTNTHAIPPKPRRDVAGERVFQSAMPRVWIERYRGQIQESTPLKMETRADCCRRIRYGAQLNQGRIHRVYA